MNSKLKKLLLQKFETNELIIENEIEFIDVVKVMQSLSGSANQTCSNGSCADDRQNSGCVNTSCAGSENLSCTNESCFAELSL